MLVPKQSELVPIFGAGDDPDIAQWLRNQANTKSNFWKHWKACSSSSQQHARKETQRTHCHSASSERCPGPSLEEPQKVTEMKDNDIRASPRAEHTCVFHAAQRFARSQQCAIYLLGSSSPKGLPEGLVLSIFPYLPDFPQVLSMKFCSLGLGFKADPFKSQNAWGTDSISQWEVTHHSGSTLMGPT